MKREDIGDCCPSRAGIFICTIVIAIALLPWPSAYALGQLMVSPTRIVFEGGDRSKQINLINNGAETARYRISLVRRNMNSDGKIIEVDASESGMYVDDMVRYSPRQVTLAPGQSQTVRLMLRKKSGTADGEYRSHMLFQSLPDPSTSDVSNLSSGQAKGLSIELIPVVGITIPIIVRQGELTASASLSDFEIKQSNTVRAQPVLSMKINREGNRSIYGDFRVRFTPKGGTPVVVGQVNGVAVYTSTNSRTIEIPLESPPGTILSNGELHISYLEPGEDEKSGLIAESRLAVP